MRCLILLIGILVCTGCEKSTPSPEVDQFHQGMQLYTSYCASCHEIDNGIGPHLKKNVIATRVNGQLLYNYNKRNMPYQAGNTLTEAQYWAITAYLLMRDGFMDSTATLSAQNASEIVLMND